MTDTGEAEHDEADSDSLSSIDVEIDSSAPLFRAIAALSDNDKEQVLRFAEFLAGAGRPGAVRHDADSG